MAYDQRLADAEGDIDLLVAENARLREALDKALTYAETRQETIDRLREALELIAAGHPDGGPWTGGAEKIAVNALNQHQP